tara:strand:- start:123 stop:1010 length:888 start_codon:yes stop_codon:yes gene_type:complete
MPGLKKGIKQIKMQDGGTKRQTREAISKRLKEKGLADVTKEELDRFKKRQKIKGSDKEALRMLLNQRKAKPKVKATDLDDPLLKPFTKKAIKKSQEQIKADVKKAEQRRETEKKKGERTAGAALALTGAGKVATNVLPKVATKVATAIKTGKDVTAVARGKTEKLKDRQVIRNKKGKISRVSNKNIKRGEALQKVGSKAKKAVDETRKTIKSATGVGVGKGPKGTQTERGAFNVIRGNISAKTVKRGRNLRKGAKIGAPTITAAATSSAAAKQAKKRKEEKAALMRAGGTFKGSF